MPALAMPLRSNTGTHRIARGWFLASLLLCGVFVGGVMGRIAWAAHDMGMSSAWELNASMFATIGGLLLIAGIARLLGYPACTLASCLLILRQLRPEHSTLEWCDRALQRQTISQTRFGCRASSFSKRFERSVSAAWQPIYRLLAKNRRRLRRCNTGVRSPLL
jgi:hypothetical protein